MVGTTIVKWLTNQFITAGTTLQRVVNRHSKSPADKMRDGSIAAGPAIFSCSNLQQPSALAALVTGVPEEGVFRMYESQELQTGWKSPGGTRALAVAVGHPLHSTWVMRDALRHPACSAHAGNNTLKAQAVAAKMLMHCFLRAPQVLSSGNQRHH